MKDRLVSTAITREHRDRTREELATMERRGALDERGAKLADWLLSEWEQAEREAAREYVPTSVAAKLTGWSEQTLRRYAQASRDGAPMPEGWEDMVSRKEGSDWTFCVSTVPIKSTNAA